MARRAVALAVASSLLALRATAQDPGAVQPYWLSPEKQANVANCVVNIGIASTFLGKAGVSINAAVDNCGKEGDTTAACTAAISGVVAGFGFGAAFISAAAAECRSSLQVVDEHKVLQEGCSAVVSVILATLSLMANAGAVIKDTCPGVRPEKVTSTEDEALDSVRRLQGLNKTLAWEKLETARRKLLRAGISGPQVKKKKKQTQPVGRTAAQNAACAFDVGQFTFLSARAGLMINYAVKDCSAPVLFEGGNLNQAKCVTDVGRAIGAFGYTASGIAFAVFECPDIIDNLDTACAGAIINLVAATSELVGNGADLANTCAELSKPLKEEERDEDGFADPVRRLSPGAVAETLV